MFHIIRICVCAANSVSLQCRNNNYVENTIQCHIVLFCILSLTLSLSLSHVSSAMRSKCRYSVGQKICYLVNRNLCRIICCHFLCNGMVKDAGNLWASFRLCQHFIATCAITQYVNANRQAILHYLKVFNSIRMYR